MVAPDSVWEIVFLMVILKIPIGYLCFVIWYAVKSKPEPGQGAGGADGLGLDDDGPGGPAPAAAAASSPARSARSVRPARIRACPVLPR